MSPRSEADPPPALKLRAHRRTRRRQRGLGEPIVKLPQTVEATAERVSTAEPAPEPEQAETERIRKAPLYWRLLRLRHVHPNGWQRALLVEGVFAVAVVLVLAGKASIWTLLVLPVLAAVLVKANDLIAGGLQRPSRSGEEKSGS
jgi:hypothetical protein